MAEFGTFVYGIGITYGSESPGISNVDVLTANSILIRLNEPVVLNEFVYDPENYTIEFNDNVGFTDVTVKEATPFVNGVPVTLDPSTQRNEVTTEYIELTTDYHTPGQEYLITITELTGIDGFAIDTTVGGVTQARRTKIEAMLDHIPPHFNRRQGGLLRSFISAMALEDDRIGGSQDLPT